MVLQDESQPHVAMSESGECTSMDHPTQACWPNHEPDIRKDMNRSSGDSLQYNSSLGRTSPNGHPGSPHAPPGQVVHARLFALLVSIRILHLGPI